MRGLNVGFGGSPASRASGSAAREVVAVLGESDTTWVASVSGRYTVYAFGRGGVAAGSQGSNALGSGGGFCRKTIPLVAGDVLTLSWNIEGYSIRVIGPGILMGAEGGLLTSVGYAAAGGAAFGGDVNVSGESLPAAPASPSEGGHAGGDGTPLGTGGRGGRAYFDVNGDQRLCNGSTPGGGGWPYAIGGAGQVRIVREAR